MQNEYAIKTPAYGGYGGVRRSGYLTANTIENSLPPNIIRHCAFASITRIGQLDVPNQQFSSLTCIVGARHSGPAQRQFLGAFKLNAGPMPMGSVAVDYGASLRSVARFKIVAVAEPGDEGISIGLDKPSGLLS